MKVYIVGYDDLIDRMFKKRDFETVDDPKDADIICFTGGADVSPHLYGEDIIPGTYCDPDRDEQEEELYDMFKANKFMVGICRGGQFLNVMNGGRMYQDVDNHTRNHFVYAPDGNKLCEVTSTHHQMMIPHHSGKVMVYGRESTTRVRQRGTFVGSPFTDDIEVVHYPTAKENKGALCFQPHPEYGHKDTEELFFLCLGAVNDQAKVFLGLDKEKV